MTDYKVGYRKPPKEHRFKKGVCPNPAGRGKRKASSTGSVARKLLNEMIEISERGRTKKISRLEALIRRLIASAVRGNVASADLLLNLCDAAASDGDVETIVVEITGGLPQAIDGPLSTMS